MEEAKVVRLVQPGEFEDALTAVLRAGARDLLAQAIEAEVEDFRSAFADQRLKDGRERLVRHGFGPERIIQTGIGPVPVRRAKAARSRRGARHGAARVVPALWREPAQRRGAERALHPVLATGWRAHQPQSTPHAPHLPAPSLCCSDACAGSQAVCLSRVRGPPACTVLRRTGARPQGRPPTRLGGRRRRA